MPHLTLCTAALAASERQRHHATTPLTLHAPHPPPRTQCAQHISRSLFFLYCVRTKSKRRAPCHGLSDTGDGGDVQFHDDFVIPLVALPLQVLQELAPLFIHQVKTTPAQTVRREGQAGRQPDGRRDERARAPGTNRMRRGPSRPRLGWEGAGGHAGDGRTCQREGSAGERRSLFAYPECLSCRFLLQCSFKLLIFAVRTATAGGQGRGVLNRRQTTRQAVGEGNPRASASQQPRAGGDSR